MESIPDSEEKKPKLGADNLPVLQDTTLGVCFVDTAQWLKSGAV